MRMKILQITMVCFGISFSSCQYHRNARIKDVVMQRVEIADTLITDEVIYKIEPIVDYIYTYHIFNCHCKKKYESVDTIDSIYVEDSFGANINEWFTPVGINKKEKIDNMMVPLASDSLQMIHISWDRDIVHDWSQIRQWLQRYEGRLGAFQFFSIPQDKPSPKYIIVKFSNRTIRAKVKNDPVRISGDSK